MRPDVRSALAEWSDGRCTSVMWFRRDLRLADNPALLEAARRRRRAPAVRARPRAVGAGRAVAPGLPRAPRCARSTPRCGSDGVARGGRGDPVAGSSAAAREVGRRRGCTSPPTTAPTARAATREVEQALAEHGIELVRTGSPYAVAPGRVTKRRRRRRTRSSRRSRGRGPSTAGAAPVDAPDGAAWLALADTVGVPDADAARRARAARGRRGAPPGGAGASSSTSRLADYDRRARPARPRRHLADVGAPQVGRDPPAHDARRPGPARAARARRRTARSWPGGSSTPTCCSHRPETAREYLRPEFARMAYDEPGDAARRVARGPHRLPDRRRRACASCARPAGCTTGCG